MRCIIQTPGFPCVRCQKARRNCIQQRGSPYTDSSVERRPTHQRESSTSEALPSCHETVSHDSSRLSPGNVTSSLTPLERETSRVQAATVHQQVHQEPRASPVLPSVYTVPPLAHQQKELNPTQEAPFQQLNQSTFEHGKHAEAHLDWESMSGLTSEEAVELIQV